MTHQEITDRLLTLGRELEAAKRHAEEMQSAEIAKLQEACGTIGHIFKPGQWDEARWCVVCERREDGKLIPNTHSGRYAQMTDELQASTDAIRNFTLGPL